MGPEYYLIDGKDTEHKSWGNNCITVWETLRDKVNKKKIYIKMNRNLMKLNIKLTYGSYAILQVAGLCTRVQ